MPKGHKSDLAGQQFGKLTALRIDNSKPTGSGFYWICQCNCGNKKSIRMDALVAGRTKSCGCIPTGKIKHGQSRSKLYSVWIGIKMRCYNPHEPAYRHYGKRGIQMCEEWRNSFQPFFDWAIEHGYSEGLSIDRIDNNGNYEPTNCRWVTQKEQNSNKRDTVFISWNGMTLSMREWSDITGINIRTINYRYRAGWPSDRIFTEAVHYKNKSTPRHHKKEQIYGSQ